MTDAEIDALDGVALRRACAEAVGWTWEDHRETGGSAFAFDGRSDRFDTGVYSLIEWAISWNDAVAAWLASKLGEDSWIYVDEDLCAVSFDGWPKGESAGCTPESLCRALLKAIAARTPGR